MTEQWGQENKEPTPRQRAVSNLLGELEAAEAGYLNGEYDRDGYIERARAIDDRLTVVGLRLAVRPWREPATR